LARSRQFDPGGTVRISPLDQTLVPMIPVSSAAPESPAEKPAWRAAEKQAGLTFPPHG
jgi:hypothetical protein